MELRHLRTFVAVAEELHFGAAASRLYLSPPAVTEHVKTLEREMGVTLFTRDRRVALTAPGKRLLGHAMATLDCVEKAIREVREQRNDASQFRIGVVSNGCGALMGEIVRTFMTSHPATHVTVEHLDFTDHCRAVLDRRVDVAFVRPAPDDERLNVTPLFDEPRIAVVPDDHPWVLAGGAVDLEMLLREQFVGLSQDVVPTFRSYLYLTAELNGAQPRLGDERCRDAPDVLAAVAAGRGVASAACSFRGFGDWNGVKYLSITDAGSATNSLISLKDGCSVLVADFLTAARTLAGLQFAASTVCV